MPLNHRITLIQGEGSVVAVAEERVELKAFSLTVIGLEGVVSTWACYPHLLPLLRLSGQDGAEGPEPCIRSMRDPIHCKTPAVYGADIISRLVRFPLPQVTELGEAQLLRLQTQNYLTTVLLSLPQYTLGRQRSNLPLSITHGASRLKTIEANPLLKNICGEQKQQICTRQRFLIE